MVDNAGYIIVHTDWIESQSSSIPELEYVYIMKKVIFYYTSSDKQSVLTNKSTMWVLRESLG